MIPYVFYATVVTVMFRSVWVRTYCSNIDHKLVKWCSRIFNSKSKDLKILDTFKFIA